MQKDYNPSEKYTQEEIDALKVPYVMQDSCVDSFCDYRACQVQSKYNFLPFFDNFGPCRQLYDRWIICQSNREFEIKERRRNSLTLIEDNAQNLRDRQSTLD